MGPASLSCGARTLSLSTPQIMGVLNVTPDSFSDGGEFFDPAQAVNRAREMVAQGASIIDVGGESTRPGAQAVSESEELARVIPVVEAITRELDVIISLDTSSPAVMQQGVAAGAGMINDVRALQRQGALEVAATLDVPVCLMHMQGSPTTMQKNPQYAGVVQEVMEFLQQRIAACEQVGIERHRVVMDPGFGFGKTLEHNLSLLRQLADFKRFNLPLLVGMSRKKMIGELTGRPTQDRMVGSVAAAMLAAQAGANILRVHDVAATMDALKVLNSIQ